MFRAMLLLYKKPSKATEAIIQWPLGMFLAVQNCWDLGIWIHFSF